MRSNEGGLSRAFHERGVTSNEQPSEKSAEFWPLKDRAPPDDTELKKQCPPPLLLLLPTLTPAALTDSNSKTPTKLCPRNSGTVFGPNTEVRRAQRDPDATQYLRERTTTAGTRVELSKQSMPSRLDGVGAGGGGVPQAPFRGFEEMTMPRLQNEYGQHDAYRPGSGTKVKATHPSNPRHHVEGITTEHSIKTREGRAHTALADSLAGWVLTTASRSARRGGSCHAGGLPPVATRCRGSPPRTGVGRRRKTRRTLEDQRVSVLCV